MRDPHRGARLFTLWSRNSRLPSGLQTLRHYRARSIGLQRGLGKRGQIQEFFLTFFLAPDWSRGWQTRFLRIICKRWATRQEVILHIVVHGHRSEQGAVISWPGKHHVHFRTQV
jgi:hypothetical protein